MYLMLSNLIALARNSPKEISGANGKFLPKPLLFHLRHPNSKTNEPKFCKILSPKNSFCKTSSALFRHLPEYLEGRTPKKNVLSTLEEISPPPNQRSKRHFSLVLPSEARQWRNDSFHIGILLEKSSDFLVQREQYTKNHHLLVFFCILLPERDNCLSRVVGIEDLFRTSLRGVKGILSM